MKKVVFLKNFRSYRKDQIAVMTDNEAKVLIALGHVEIYNAIEGHNTNQQNYQNRMLTTSNQPAPITEPPKRRGRAAKPKTDNQAETKSEETAVDNAEKTTTGDSSSESE